MAIEEEKESSTEELIKKRKKMILNLIHTNSKNIFYLFLLFVLWISVYIRTLPMKIVPVTGNPGLWDITKNTWTLGPDLDPFLFLRWAKIIVNEGSLPSVDYARYVPLGYNTSGESQLLPIMIAWTHKVINTFSPETNVDYSGVVFPVIASVLTGIVFFLFVREVFKSKGKEVSNIIAIISTLFLVLSPSFLQRSIAGIPEKESIAFMFMFLSLYLYLQAWNSEKTIKKIIFGGLAGISTGVMGLIWGGVIFVFVIISISTMIAFFTGNVKNRKNIPYVLWIIFAFLIMVLFSTKYSFTGLLTSPVYGFCAMILLLILVNQIVFNTVEIKNRLIRKDLTKKIYYKIPSPLASLIITVIIIFIFTGIIFGPSFIGDKFEEITTVLIRSTTDRLGVTVAENSQPYFDQWRESFGPKLGVLNIGVINKTKLKDIPIYFWLFFIGSIVLFWELMKDFEYKEKIISISSFTFLLFGIIFSRYSPDRIMNGVSRQSKIFYGITVVVFALCILYIFYERYKRGKNEEIVEKINFNYIIILVTFLVGLIAGRGAVRLIMVLSITSTIIVSYLVTKAFVKAYYSKGKWKKRILWTLTTIIIIGVIFCLINNYKLSKITGENQIPNQYTQQWQKAMAWVRENTPQNSVFGHWWDYGYWVQSISERATMLDGGNAITYWNYLMGRHILTGANESEALDVLYAHNVTHFLIDSTDIGKYGAYSSIGSDENYDRLSQIPTFIRDYSSTKKLDNFTLIVYNAGIVFDDNMEFIEGEKTIIFPSKSSGIVKIILPINEENGDIGQPYSIVVNQGRQQQVPIRYVYMNNKLIDFNFGINITMYVLPSINTNENTFSVDRVGAMLYLSQRSMNALWVKLYLLNQSNNFKIVHTEPSFVVESIKSQGLELGDFIYYQGVQGPIKIWKINYTGDEKINPEYLQTYYPDRLKERSIAK